jgi:hypothetical protein
VASLKAADFYVVTPCSPVNVYQRFAGVAVSIIKAICNI